MLIINQYWIFSFANQNTLWTSWWGPRHCGKLKTWFQWQKIDFVISFKCLVFIRRKCFAENQIIEFLLHKISSLNFCKMLSFTSYGGISFEKSKNWFSVVNNQLFSFLQNWELTFEVYILSQCSSVRPVMFMAFYWHNNCRQKQGATEDTIIEFIHHSPVPPYEFILRKRFHFWLVVLLFATFIAESSSTNSSAPNNTSNSSSGTDVE